MDAGKLVRMANSIGAFFEAEPDPARAVAGVADHLRRFWDPRMRRALYAWLDAHGGDGHGGDGHDGDGDGGGDALRPLVLQAVTEQRERLAPPPLPAVVAAPAGK